MRLINADAMLDMVDLLNDRTYSKREIAAMINTRSTTYDINEVVEELEKLQKEAFSYAFKYNDEFYNGQSDGLGKAIEIVKQELKGKEINDNK